MRILCRLALLAAAVAVVSCGGERQTSSLSDRATDSVVPADRALELAAAYSALADDYDALCRERSEALAETDDDLRRERLAATDSLVVALADRSRELDSMWWQCAADYRDRCDGSFTEFCRAADVDSARVDADIYRINE